MQAFTLQASDGKDIHGLVWADVGEPKAVVQIAHGMGEHIARYGALANALNGAGYVVYGNDHRGHGETDPERPGDMGDDGWNRVIDDARTLNDHIAASHPDTPRVLLGHSMGSMLATQYLYRHGTTLSAAALSGTPGINAGFSAWLSRVIARFERWRLGPEAESPIMQNLLFGGSNKAFDGPDATGFEWLSRDAEQVQRYADDPMCGFVLRTGSLVDLFGGAREAARQENIDQIPKSLPIYILNGSDDPVHREGDGIERLTACYRQAGLQFKDTRYPGGRHEMFNEINSDEVTADLIGWLDGVFTEGAGRDG